MASAAAASRPPAPPPPPSPPPAAASPAPAVQWLGPRVSFSLDDAGGSGGGREAVVAAGAKAGPSAGADFEFLLGGCAAASMLPADELFSEGKLVPLRIPAPSPDEEATGVTMAQVTLPPKQAPAVVEQRQPETPRAEEAKGVAVAGGEEPKIPARRWRDLLRLRKQQASSGSGSGSAAANSSEPRPLRRLLRRGPKPPEPEPSLSLPLLREADPDDKLPTEKPASAPAPAPISTTAPPVAAPSQHHQSCLPPKIRLSPSQQASSSSPPPPPPPPPPPAAVAADSPRLNAAGKVVFNGLGRSSSSPSSLAGGRRAGHRAGAMERSYSAHVRVAPVLNVPVCSLRGSRKSVSVFGIDRLFSPSAGAAASSSSSAGGSKRNKAAKKDVTASASAAPQ